MNTDIKFYIGILLHKKGRR